MKTIFDGTPDVRYALPQIFGNPGYYVYVTKEQLDWFVQETHRDRKVAIRNASFILATLLFIFWPFLSGTPENDYSSYFLFVLIVCVGLTGAIFITKHKDLESFKKDIEYAIYITNNRNEFGEKIFNPRGFVLMKASEY